MRGISWLAANRLAAQEGLCTMEEGSKYRVWTWDIVIHALTHVSMLYTVSWEYRNSNFRRFKSKILQNMPARFQVIRVAIESLGSYYKGTDNTLALPGRKQSNVSVRMMWISFGALPCRKKKTWWQLASRCCWNRSRPCHASELVSILVGLRTYQHPCIIACNWSTGMQRSSAWVT